MGVNKEFNDVQLFIKFLKEVQGDAKLSASILYSNLDPSGSTNIAIEFAKIYSWYTKMIDYVPPGDGETGDGSFKLKGDVIPDSVKGGTIEGHYDPNSGKFIDDNGQEVSGEGGIIYVDTVNNTIYRYDENTNTFQSIDQHTKYDFREGNVAGAFEVSEDGGAYQSIPIHNVATLIDGKIDPSQMDADAISNLLGDFQGATSTTAGKTGLVPAPAAGDQNTFLKGNATWGDPVEDFRGSVNDGTNTLILHCTNGST